MDWKSELCNIIKGPKLSGVFTTFIDTKGNYHNIDFPAVIIRGKVYIILHYYVHGKLIKMEAKKI